MKIIKGNNLHRKGQYFVEYFLLLAVIVVLTTMGGKLWNMVRNSSETFCEGRIETVNNLSERREANNAD